MAQTSTVSDVHYSWKNSAQIYTYPNPKELDEIAEISKLMRKYPHFCASNTLMQGLEEKYGRSHFSIISSVDKLVHYLFSGLLDNAATDLQMYLDISRMIDAIPDAQSGSANFRRAFEQNKAEIVAAFKLLVLADYASEDIDETNEALDIFYRHIYLSLKDIYIQKIKDYVAKLSSNDIKGCMESILIDEIGHYMHSKEKIKSFDEAKKTLLNAIEDESPENAHIRTKAIELLKISEEFNGYDFSSIVIHGVLRFTPEIMKTIEVLDSIGIHIIFMFNYAENLPQLYQVWDKAYAWTGCNYESAFSINIGKGVDAGKRIATVCAGKRVSGRCNALIKEYKYLTDFTDGEVRKTYDKALKLADGVNEVALSKMDVQYYAVDPDKANEVLKNYFPEQFTEKPFMSYPVGRFVAGIYSMWDFDNEVMEIDFDELMECSVAHIGHNTEKMGEIIRNVRLFFSDLKNIKDIESRAEELRKHIGLINLDKEYQYRQYLSFYSLTQEELNCFISYIFELEKISKQIFDSPKSKLVNYREHFHKTMEIVNSAASEKLKVSEKEQELVGMLLDALSIDTADDVLGSAKELRNALQFFLATKREKKSSDWIIRGFDQLDGAPFLCEKSQKKYEFSLVSMKNMTRDGKDLIPWPLTEGFLSKSTASNIYMMQLKNMVDTRSEYLLYYLFYASFFSCAGIQFSYVVHENDEKQRLYFLLNLINANEPKLGNFHKRPKDYQVSGAEGQPPITIEISERERRIFSVCKYKYFLSSIMKERINYSSQYQTLYFIKNEAALMASDLCGYDKSKLTDKSDDIIATLKAWYPFLDESNLSDIRQFISSHFFDKKPDDIYIQKKRDFLIAQWEEADESGVRIKYMDFGASRNDVKNYISSTHIYPSYSEWPKSKVCQECNYNEICMKYYFDKVVDS